MIYMYVVAMHGCGIGYKYNAILYMYYNTLNTIIFNGVQQTMSTIIQKSIMNAAKKRSKPLKHSKRNKRRQTSVNQRQNRRSIGEMMEMGTRMDMKKK